MVGKNQFSLTKYAPILRTSVFLVCMLRKYVPFLVCVLRRTNTVNVVWRLSSFTGGGRPQVLLHASLQARADTGEEPPTFRKLDSFHSWKIQRPCRGNMFYLWTWWDDEIQSHCHSQENCVFLRKINSQAANTKI